MQAFALFGAILTRLSSPASLYGMAAGKQCESLLLAACLLPLAEAPAMLLVAFAYRWFLICKVCPALQTWLGSYPVCQAALVMLWAVAQGCRFKEGTNLDLCLLSRLCLTVFMGQVDMQW